MTSKDFRNRLQQLIDKYNGRKAFAAAIDAPYSTVSEWIKRGSFPSEEHLASIARIGENINWLLTGIGPRYVETPRRDVSGIAEEVAEYEPLSRHDKAYIDKLRTVLKEGNETAKGMIKIMIDKAIEEIEDAKKTKIMAG